MDRLTMRSRSSQGKGVLKQPFKCEVCRDLQWIIPDMGMGSPTDRLADYEDLEEQGKLLKLPCAVGDTVYTNTAIQGWHLKKKGRPYEVKVAFIGINGADNCMHVAYDNGCMSQFWFSEIGKTIFLTREEAEDALKQSERGGGKGK